jgi:YbbR domain-containing protein
VGRISKVIVQVDIDGKQGTQQGSKALTALDSNNQEIKGLTFDPPTVQVSVPIKLLLNYKTVAVRAPVVGQPAPGYRVSAINLDPTNVTVCCSPTLLDPLKTVNAEPVAITGTTSTVVTTTNLILPKGVELYPGQPKQITVTVDVEVMETRFQVSVATSFQGLQPGWGAIASPDKLDLTLAGTFEQSQNLNPADMRAVIDLTGKGAGTYQIKPQVIVPQGIKLDLASPDTVTVTVVAPTPSPTATSSPEPTRTTTPTREAVTTLPTAVPTRSPQPEPSTAVPTVVAPSSTATPTHTPTPQTPGAP